MVGRKPLVQSSEILKKLLQYDIFQDEYYDLINKKTAISSTTERSLLKERTDPVWKETCKFFDNKKLPASLYLDLYKNMNNIRDHYKMQKNIFVSEFIEDYEEHVSDSTDNCDNDSETEIVPIKKQKYNKTIEFDIELSADQWSKICVIKKTYKDGREGEILQPGWTHIINQAIYNKQRLPCCFNFKRHTINKYDAFIILTGYCKTCQIELEAKCYAKPSENSSIKFTVTTMDSRDIPHQEKRKLTGPIRDQIKEELKHKKPKSWRRDEAFKVMKFNDPEPATLFNLAALQNARQQAIYEDLGLKQGENIFDSLNRLKKDSDISKFFKQIGYNKFYVSYWSPEQTNVYNDIQRYLKNPVSLDATGSVAIKLNRPDEDSSDLLLSVLCTHVNNIIVPVAQVISEINDSNFLCFWLRDWLKSGAVIPKEVVTDMGKAIQQGVCMACNNINFSQYNDECLSILLGKKSSRLKLNTQLRTDVAHFQHLVAKWLNKNCNSAKVKEFYKKAVGFMTTIENFEYFKKFLNLVFSVTNSKLNESCSQALKFIAERIKTFNFDETLLQKMKGLETNEKKISLEYQDEKLDDKHSFVYDFIQKILNNCMNNTNNEEQIGAQSNDYYLPEFGKYLATLCKEFPCWTNVMNNYFKNPRKVATSARSEGYFAQFKREQLDDKNPMKVDKLLAVTCRTIDKDMVLIRSSVNNAMKTSSKNCFEKDEKDHLLVAEQWKNKCTMIEYEENLELEIIEDEKKTFESFSNFNVDNNNLNISDNNDNSSNEINSSSDFKKCINYNSTQISDLPQVFNKSDDFNKSDVFDSKNKYNTLSLILDESYISKLHPYVVASDHNSADTNEPLKISTVQRGIYVSADPEFSLRQQKPINCRKFKGNGLLRNGNHLSPYKIKGQSFMLMNTCAYDSITEILSTCFSNIQSFKNFIDVSGNNNRQCYATTVKEYSLFGVNRSVYSNRFNILKSIFSADTNNQINCVVNVNQMFDKLMFTYDSNEEILNCNNCGEVYRIKRRVILLPNLKIVWKFKYENLENEMNNYFEEKEMECHLCKNKALLQKHLGPYLYIDVEDAYKNSTYASEKYNLKEEDLKTNLSNIPKKLSIKNKKYVLCGVIQYIPPVLKDGVGHYIAHCKSINDTWITKNDLLKKKSKLSKKLPEIKIAAIIYAKCE